MAVVWIKPFREQIRRSIVKSRTYNSGRERLGDGDNAMKDLTLAMLISLACLGDVAAEESPTRRMAAGATFSGVIKSVDEDGSLRFADGGAMQLWGLLITDRQLAETFLVGLTARCALLPDSSEAQVGDCSVYQPDTNGTFVSDVEYDFPGVAIDLFLWLPRFGVATQSCTPLTRAVDGVVHTWRNYKYRCSVNPFRQLQGLQIE
jgi:hypothetical protein